MSRARIAAVKAALPAVERLALTDTEGFALANEVGPENCRHAAALKAALAAQASLPPRPTDDDALIAWALKAKAAREAFWDAFEGEIVDGVEIVRVRA
jgi:hypothetical protein